MNLQSEAIKKNLTIKYIETERDGYNSETGEYDYYYIKFITETNEEQ